MYIGATEHEVQESKKQESTRHNLTNYDKRRSANGEINNPNVVTKSYPLYWDHLKEAGFGIIEN